MTHAEETAPSQGAPRAVFFSAHFFPSKRRAGFQHLATAFAELGWDVLFVTTGISWLSYAVRDARLQQGARGQALGIVPVAPSIWSHVWFTPWHPVNLRSDLLNTWTTPVFGRYGGLPRSRDVRTWIEGASLIVIESSPVLMSFGALQRAYPEARTVYRVSDDLRFLRPHPVVLKAEERVASRFDLVSSPTSQIHARFAQLPTARLQPHGIRKDLFQGSHPNPYAGNGYEANVVFVGASYLDQDFVGRAARMFPHVGFHLIGPLPRRLGIGNVVYYGEVAFEETIPYLQHASVGLQALVWTPAAESLIDSLKMHQYAYLGLPVVAPEFLRSGRVNVRYYHPGDDASIRAAMAVALASERDPSVGRDVLSWRELAEELIGYSGVDLDRSTDGARRSFASSVNEAER